MSNFTLINTFKKNAVLSGFDQKIHCLVRFQAPDKPADLAKRPPLNLAIVLDRSGSMSGQPLDEAKRCANHIIERLEATDNACVVAYDNRVQVVVPTTSANNKALFQQRISTIQPGGSTDLFGGWEAGGKQLLDHLQANAISRVLLLSDGCANAGLRDPEEIAKRCAQLSEQGISTSSYGLGRNFNEALMVQMAESGNGNSYYGETAADLQDPFMEEFDLLNSICGKQIRLQCHGTEGVTVQVMNTLLQSPQGYNLPDVAYDGEVWVVLEITVPAAQTGVGIGDKVNLGTVTLVMQNLDGESQEFQSDLSLPSLNAAAFDVVLTDQLVENRILEVNAANIQLEASKAARRNDWDRVDQLLQEARANAGNNEWLQQVVQQLEALAQQRNDLLFTKEAYYSSRKMSRRMAAKHELHHSNDGTAVPSFLRRKLRQGKKGPNRPTS